MRENDQTTTGATESRPDGEDVALSPYDTDLGPAGEVEPEPYTLESPGYDAPAEPAAALPDLSDEAAAGDVEARADAARPVETAAPVDVAPPPPAGDAAFAPPAAVAGAAAAGVAAGAAAATSELSDTGVRRTRIMQPLPESNEPRRLMTEPEADPRAERYSPAPLPEPDLVTGSEYDRVPSRAGAHWWAILATLLLSPVAWYLLADAGARMTLPAGSQWETGSVNLAAVAELVGGLVVLGVILWAARASSLGAFILGGLLVLVGGAFVVMPRQVQNLLEPYLENLLNYNDMGANIAHHLEADGSTGRILIAGFVLVMIGFISHGARRRGRAEQRIREIVERRKATGL